MQDIIFIVLTGALVAATWGIVALCRALKEPS
jgi:hypothetical protein